MTTVNCYLTFDGSCEAAFNFYKSVFGGEFTYLGRFKDMRSEVPVPDSVKERIMHVALPISKETCLMGSDTSEFSDYKITFGNNISVSVNAETEEEARRIYNALSAGGKVIMPLEKAFWGALYGHFEDRFGICWMVNFDYNAVKK